jgi:16S rRNA G966 N2-methylase RsmD
MDLVKHKKCQFKKNELVIADSVNNDEWLKIGAMLHFVEGAVQFWIGDWARFGDKRGFYTDSKVYDQLEEVTGLDRTTIQTYKSVADSVPSLLRNKDISFSHHKEVAKLPPKEQKKFLELASEQHLSVRNLRTAINKDKIAKIASSATNASTGKKARLICDDIRNVVLDKDSVDLILTDPPYPAEYLDLWSDLGKMAARSLKPGKLLIAYSGQFHLPKVINMLSEHLEYYWTFCLYMPGDSQIVHGRNVICRWKPILLFQRPPISKILKTPQDCIVNDKKNKSLHEWQQGIEGITKLVEIFSFEGETILDPFAGSGTTIIAALKSKRRVIGIDIEEQNINIIKARMKENGI